jgi:hypothetical protein
VGGTPAIVAVGGIVVHNSVCLFAFRKATGQEAGGQYIDPRLLKPYPKEGDADPRPGPSSPCKDCGVRIRGVNDTFQGSGPDVGAFEID